MDRKEAETPGEKELPPLGHSLGKSGCLGKAKSEKRGSSTPCLLLLQDSHSFHIYCKQAELEITVSFLRVNQLAESSHNLLLTAFTSRCPGARASHCTQTVAQVVVLVLLGIAHFCLSTSSCLLVYIKTANLEIEVSILVSPPFGTVSL